MHFSLVPGRHPTVYEATNPTISPSASLHCPCKSLLISNEEFKV